MNKDTIKFLLEGQRDSFKQLTERNFEMFKDTEEDYYLGKKQAYDTAAKAFEELLKNYFKEG